MGEQGIERTAADLRRGGGRSTDAPTDVSTSGGVIACCARRTSVRRSFTCERREEAGGRAGASASVRQGGGHRHGDVDRADECCSTSGLGRDSVSRIWIVVKRKQVNAKGDGWRGAATSSISRIASHRSGVASGRAAGLGPDAGSGEGRGGIHGDQVRCDPWVSAERRGRTSPT